MIDKSASVCSVIGTFPGADAGFGQGGGAPGPEAESCRRSEAESCERSEQFATGV